VFERFHSNWHANSAGYSKIFKKNKKIEYLTNIGDELINRIGSRKKDSLSDQWPSGQPPEGPTSGRAAHVERECRSCKELQLPVDQVFSGGEAVVESAFDIDDDG
jgi:hypothetical protein